MALCVVMHGSAIHSCYEDCVDAGEDEECLTIHLASAFMRQLVYGVQE